MTNLPVIDVRSKGRGKEINIHDTMSSENSGCPDFSATSEPIDTQTSIENNVAVCLPQQYVKSTRKRELSQSMKQVGVSPTYDEEFLPEAQVQTKDLGSEVGLKATTNTTEASTVPLKKMRLPDYPPEKHQTGNEIMEQRAHRGSVNLAIHSLQEGHQEFIQIKDQLICRPTIVPQASFSTNSSSGEEPEFNRDDSFIKKELDTEHLGDGQYAEKLENKEKSMSTIMEGQTRSGIIQYNPGPDRSLHEDLIPLDLSYKPKNASHVDYTSCGILFTTEPPIDQLTAGGYKGEKLTASDSCDGLAQNLNLDSEADGQSAIMPQDFSEPVIGPHQISFMSANAHSHAIKSVMKPTAGSAEMLAANQRTAAESAKTLAANLRAAAKSAEIFAESAERMAANQRAVAEAPEMLAANQSPAAEILATNQRSPVEFTEMVASNHRATAESTRMVTPNQRAAAESAEMVVVSHYATAENRPVSPNILALARDPGQQSAVIIDQRDQGLQDGGFATICIPNLTTLGMTKEDGTLKQTLNENVKKKRRKKLNK